MEQWCNHHATIMLNHLTNSCSQNVGRVLWNQVGMLSPFRLKALCDLFWVTETGEMGFREFAHLNSWQVITTVIPYQQLWLTTSTSKSPEEEVSTLRHTFMLRRYRTMRELWDVLHVRAIVWYHSSVCQQDRGYIGIWDSDNGSCHTHSFTVT